MGVGDTVGFLCLHPKADMEFIREGDKKRWRKVLDCVFLRGGEGMEGSVYDPI